MNQTVLNSYKQVYVVDDDPLIAQTVSLILSTHGYRVKAFASAEECVSAVSDEMPDLVIADVFLRHMSGLEMAAQFACSHPGLNCLLVSARSVLIHEHEHADPEKLFEVYQKPLHPNVLLKEVRRRTETAEATRL